MAMTCGLRGLIVACVTAAALLGGAPWAGAQTPSAQPPRAQSASAAPAASLEPPRAITETTVAYPAGAPAHEQPITVRVVIRVGKDGAVTKVTLRKPDIAVFDAAVVGAAEKFVFQPGRYGGQPVVVDIAYAHTFLPPVRAPAKVKVDSGPARDAFLRGRLREKGTRLPVQRATVTVRTRGRSYTTLSDQRGRFRLAVPAGRLRVTVHSAGYLAFLQIEGVKPNEELAVAYLVERDSYDPYEIVVFSEKRRTEVSRITLRGRELSHIPGTFGDPFRVIHTLPGVTSVMSLLPFPVVRGASPGSTGFLIDGIRVPMLFHWLAGPSVIHPEFIDEISFYPGGFPVSYGGYTAGIIDGRTRRARSDEVLADVDINFLQTGAMIRHPVPGINATATAAGRIGYPGLLLSLATDDVSLSYWDYQLRLDGGSPQNGYTVFAYGANDTLKALPDGADPNDPEVELDTALQMYFHRLELRYQHTSRDVSGVYRLIGGLDASRFGPVSGFSTLSVESRGKWHWRWREAVELRAGVEGLARDTELKEEEEEAQQGPSTDEITGQMSRFYSASLWLEALWRPSAKWLIRPGLRGDIYNDRETTAPGFDPRYSMRYRLDGLGMPRSASATVRDDEVPWVKGSVGMFHQPPRIFLPLPGLDTLPLRYGLLAAIQASLGLEVPLGHGFSVDAQAFYNDMDPVVFDLSINQGVEDLQQTPLGRNPGRIADLEEDQQGGARDFLDSFVVPQQGRAYGFELLLRRRARSGAYGWMSYTLSHSEREREGEWVAFDFDRTHLLNLVAGIPLPRNWEFGARFQYQSGKPATTTHGYNSARTNGYMRVDIRFDKRAVWRRWLLDFYVDIGNVLLFPEEVAPGEIIKYFLPTVGFRGRL